MSPAAAQKTSSWSRLADGTVAVKVYLNAEEKRRWEKEAAQGTARVPNLSHFIKTVVNERVNDLGGASAPGMGEAQLEAQISSLKLEIERLQQDNNQLKKREVGISGERILSHLSEEVPKSYKELLDELLATEADALYEGLQHYMRTGRLEHLQPHDKYRLFPKAGGRPKKPKRRGR